MVEVWFFYIISAVVLWGLNSIVDKVVLTKYLSSFSYFLAYTPATLILIIGILLFVPINFFSTPSYLAFFASIVGAIGYYLYAFAMKREDASRIVALTNLYPVFVAILAAFLVNEIFSTRIYLGVIIMVAGAALISYRRGALKKMIPLMLMAIIILANFSFASEQTISKLSLETLSFWQFFVVYLMGRVFMVFPPLLIPSLRKGFAREIKNLKKSIILLLAFSTAGWLLALIFFFYAASLGPITLVSTISISSPFITLMAIVFISRFWPKILKEEIDTKTVALKLFSIVLIFLGTWLIIA